MLTLVPGDNLLVLFVGWEGVGPLFYLIDSTLKAGSETQPRRHLLLTV